MPVDILRDALFFCGSYCSYGLAGMVFTSGTERNKICSLALDV